MNNQLFDPKKNIVRESTLFITRFTPGQISSTGMWTNPFKIAENRFGLGKCHLHHESMEYDDILNITYGLRLKKTAFSIIGKGNVYSYSTAMAMFSDTTHYNSVHSKTYF